MHRAIFVSISSALVIGLAATFGATTAACSSDSNTGPTSTPDSGNDSSTPENDAGNDGETPKYMPEGYTQMAYLRTTAKHEFTKAEQVIEPGKSYVAVVETDVGSMTLELLADETPTTVNSFVFLSLNHFYEGIAFHRVIEGFMAQTGDPNSISGDPSSWGTGGCGYNFGLEVKDSLKFSGAGVLGMARSNDPNSNGSQFFITFATASSLDKQYTVWGKLTEGADTLAKIKRGNKDDNGAIEGTPTRIVEIRIGAK